METTKLVLVTGAGHRLGAAFASHLAGRGYGIILHFHRSEKPASALAEKITSMGVPVFPARADLRSVRQIGQLADFVRSLCADSRYELALLVNSAAEMHKADLFDLTPAAWDRTLDLNLKAPLFLARELYAVMPSGGSIVNISDSGANKTWNGYPAYVISKSSLEMLTKLMAKTYAPRLRVNAIAPGLVLPGGSITTDEWNRLVERTPMKRPVAICDLLLAMDQLIDNPSITGQVLTVDAGYSLV